jgi:hypothetical protein
VKVTIVMDPPGGAVNSPHPRCIALNSNILKTFGTGRSVDSFAEAWPQDFSTQNIPGLPRQARSESGLNQFPFTFEPTHPSSKQQDWGSQDNIIQNFLTQEPPWTALQPDGSPARLPFNVQPSTYYATPVSEDGSTHSAHGADLSDSGYASYYQGAGERSPENNGAGYSGQMHGQKMPEEPVRPMPKSVNPPKAQRSRTNANSKEIKCERDGCDKILSCPSQYE